jgi:ABC-type transporter Mla MlaB component
MTTAMIQTEEHADGIHLIFNGDFTVKNAAQIVSALTVSASRKGSEILSLTNATAIDVAGIQLAYCWKTTLESQDRNVKIVLPESESLTDLLQKTGITKIL